jgi:hypothetical protein
VKTLDPRRTWWWGRTAQNRLKKWALALLRGKRYVIKIEENGTGYHDPLNRVIQANPALFPRETPETQFRLTQGILAHEVGHAWFTGAWPDQREGRLQELTNYLEDERVERAVSIFYPGVAPALWMLGDQMLARQEPLSRASPADQAYACCLVWRWANRRLPERNMLARLHLSPSAERLWARAKPLAERAWTAVDTEQVIELARQILAILGIDPQDHPLRLPDLPAAGIPARRADPPRPFPSAPAEETQPGLGRAEPNDELDRLFADAYSRPAPYVELEDQAWPLARQLAAALTLPTPDTRPEPHESQGRYSFRQETRTPETPHLLHQGVEVSPRDLALYLLVDRSGSMGTIQESVRLALMSLYLAGTELEIPTGLGFFGACDTERRERVLEVTPPLSQASEAVKALIAGYEGETSSEFLDWGLAMAEKALLARPERRKILAVIHDGDPVYKGPDGDDWALSYAHLRRLDRAGFFVVGVYLGDEGEYLQRVQALFPRLAACEAGDLSEKLGSLLRGLA